MNEVTKGPTGLFCFTKKTRNYVNFLTGNAVASRGENLHNSLFADYILYYGNTQHSNNSSRRPRQDDLDRCVNEAKWWTSGRGTFHGF